MLRGNLIRIAYLGVVLGLAGCGGDDEPRLMNLRGSTMGPDEFSIVPNKPLTMPEDLAVLPEPAPNGTNLSDPTPRADAVAALGGDASASARKAPDGGLVGYAARHGTDPAIRAELAAEDLEWRRDNQGRILERLLKINVYYKAYAEMHLDQQAELARWRKAGVRTPSAPPAPELLEKPKAKVSPYLLED